MIKNLTRSKVLDRGMNFCEGGAVSLAFFAVAAIGGNILLPEKAPLILKQVFDGAQYLGLAGISVSLLGAAAIMGGVLVHDALKR